MLYKPVEWLWHLCCSQSILYSSLLQYNTTATGKIGRQRVMEHGCCNMSCRKTMQWRRVPLVSSDTASPSQAEESSSDTVAGTSSSLTPSLVPRLSSDAASCKPLRQPFTQDEVQAIVEGVRTHGAGQWATIKAMSQGRLDQRSTVQIKDKYRNLVCGPHGICMNKR